MKKLKPFNKARIWVAITLILTLYFLALDFPQLANKAVDWTADNVKIQLPYFHSLPFHLGLDLQGGTHLVYEADVSHIDSSERSSAVEGVRDVIERRVNSLGVAEPLVQTNKSGDHWRVIVELAGITDVSEAIKMIGETPLLEFKEANNQPTRELTAEERQEMDDYNANVKKRAEQIQQQIADGVDFAELLAKYNEDQEFPMGDMGFITEDGPYAMEYGAVSNLQNGQIGPMIEDNSSIKFLKKIDERQQKKEIKARHLLICYEGATHCSLDRSKEDALNLIQDIQKEITVDNFEQMVKEKSDEPNAAETGGDLGWFGEEITVEPFEKAAFALGNNQISEIVETEFGYHLILKEDERLVKEIEVQRLLLAKKQEIDIIPPADQWKNTELTGKNLKRSMVQFDPNTNAPMVGLEFDDEGKKMFADITTRNVGNPVAIYLDGSPISVPRVNEPIREGRAVITGNFNLNEAKLLAQRLNAGALPVPINLISQQTVGASLGHQSINDSLEAGIWGLIIVAIYLLLYYRLPGFMSILALIFYGVLVLLIFKLIPVTLTLSGIAGFILSIGMAVDANVLIFARLKEELRMGRSVSTAIEEAFKRAWPSIRDGNLSTLITCFILLWFGTSMIKGFAITLSIGIIISMFSAILVTRVLLRMFRPDKMQEKLWLLSGGIKKSDIQE